MPRLWVQGYHRGRAVDSDPGEITLDKISQATMFNMLVVAESYVPVGGDLSSISREMRSLGEIWSSWSFSYTEKIYSHVTTSNSNYSVKEEITLCTLVGILLHPLLSNLTVCEG